MTKTRITWANLTSSDMNLTITYGSAPSPFGQCFLAISNDRICKLAFFDTADELDALTQELQKDWSTAQINADNATIKPWVRTIFDTDKEIKLLLQGTPFQLKVWDALLSIPKGNIIPYQEIANIIDQPKAVRAAASAIANNNIAYLIPCHRVIRKNGDLGQFRWGKERKRSIITWERA